MNWREATNTRVRILSVTLLVAYSPICATRSQAAMHFNSATFLAPVSITWRHRWVIHRKGMPSR